MILEIRNKITDTIFKVECNESGTPLIDNWKPIIKDGVIITNGESFTNTELSDDPITPDYSEVYEIV